MLKLTYADIHVYIMLELGYFLSLCLRYLALFCFPFYISSTDPVLNLLALHCFGR